MSEKEITKEQMIAISEKIKTWFNNLGVAGDCAGCRLLSVETSEIRLLSLYIDTRSCVYELSDNAWIIGLYFYNSDDDAHNPGDLIRKFAAMLTGMENAGTVAATESDCGAIMSKKDDDEHKGLYINFEMQSMNSRYDIHLFLYGPLL